MSKKNKQTWLSDVIQGVTLGQSAAVVLKARVAVKTDCTYTSSCRVTSSGLWSLFIQSKTRDFPSGQNINTCCVSRQFFTSIHLLGRVALKTVQGELLGETTSQSFMSGPGAWIMKTSLSPTLKTSSFQTLWRHQVCCNSGFIVSRFWWVSFMNPENPESCSENYPAIVFYDTGMWDMDMCTSSSEELRHKRIQHGGAHEWAEPLWPTGEWATVLMFAINGCHHQIYWSQKWPYLASRGRHTRLGIRTRCGCK